MAGSGTGADAKGVALLKVLEVVGGKQFEEHTLFETQRHLLGRKPDNIRSHAPLPHLLLA